MLFTKLTAESPNRAARSASEALRSQSGLATRSVPFGQGMSGGATWFTSSDSGCRAEVAWGAVVSRNDVRSG